jgi:hypothetical protein
MSIHIFQDSAVSLEVSAATVDLGANLGGPDMQSSVAHYAAVGHTYRLWKTVAVVNWHQLSAPICVAANENVLPTPAKTRFS